MEDINIRLKIAENGVVVTVCDYAKDFEDEGREKTYVYEELKDALKEIPSLVSVAKEEKKDKKGKMTEADLDKEEKRINSSMED